MGIGGGEVKGGLTRDAGPVRRTRKLRGSVQRCRCRIRPLAIAEIARRIFGEDRDRVWAVEARRQWPGRRLQIRVGARVLEVERHRRGFAVEVVVDAGDPAPDILDVGRDLDGIAGDPATRGLDHRHDGRRQIGEFEDRAAEIEVKGAAAVVSLCRHQDNVLLETEARRVERLIEGVARAAVRDTVWMCSATISSAIGIDEFDHDIQGRADRWARCFRSSPRRSRRRPAPPGN